MLRLRYYAESKDDLKRIARFIATDTPVTARQWVAKIREKCRIVAQHPEVGDSRPEFGKNMRSTYVGSYVIFFRRADGFVDIVRVICGDRDTRSL